MIGSRARSPAGHRRRYWAPLGAVVGRHTALAKPRQGAPHVVLRRRSSCIPQLVRPKGIVLGQSDALVRRRTVRDYDHRGEEMTTVVTEFQETTGAPNGVPKVPFNRWFRYPAGFSTATLDAAVAAADIPDGGNLVDCFAGSAAVGVAAMQAGHAFVGIEANPLVAGLGALKVTRPNVSGAAVRKRGEGVLAALDETVGIRVDGEHPLIVKCYSEESLRQLVALRDMLRSSRRPVDRYLRCALVGLLRETARVNTGWPYQRPTQARQSPIPSVPDRFRVRFEAIGEDIDRWKSGWTAGRVVNGDARMGAAWRSIPGASIDACVTSPPYLNNYDYLDATRLELYFLGDAASWSDLLSLARRRLVIATTHHSTAAITAAAEERLRKLAAYETVRALGDALAKAQEHRARPKEYDQMLLSYVADIHRVLRRLARSLRYGGKAVFVVGDSAPYGVHIDTPGLIADLGSEVGLELRSSSVVRNRGERWRTNGTRHQVALSEKLLVLQRVR